LVAGPPPEHGHDDRLGALATAVLTPLPPRGDCRRSRNAVGHAGMSLLRFTFLGTSAAQPTIHRNLSGLAVKADSDLLLFDCGEGSQRQMIRYGTGFAVDAVFFTHFHADPYLGIIGFLRTLGVVGGGGGGGR